MEKQLNDRIKIIRRELGIQQGEMAKILEVKQGSISDIERGRIGVSIKLIEKIIKSFSVSREWFYSGQGEMFTTTTTTENKTSYEPIKINISDLKNVLPKGSGKIIQEKAGVSTTTMERFFRGETDNLQIVQALIEYLEERNALYKKLENLIKSSVTLKN